MKHVAIYNTSNKSVYVVSTIRLLRVEIYIQADLVLPQCCIPAEVIHIKIAQVEHKILI